MECKVNSSQLSSYLVNFFMRMIDHKKRQSNLKRWKDKQKIVVLQTTKRKEPKKTSLSILWANGKLIVEILGHEGYWKDNGRYGGWNACYSFPNSLSLKLTKMLPTKFWNQRTPPLWYLLSNGPVTRPHQGLSLSLSFSPWGLSGRGPWEGDWFITVFKWNCTFIRLVSHPSSIKLLLPQLLFGVTQFFLRSPTLCIITSYCKISNSFSITSFCCFDKSLGRFFQQKSSSAV